MYLEAIANPRCKEKKERKKNWVLHIIKAVPHIFMQVEAVIYAKSTS